MKQKISSSFVNMVGVLFLITALSATALSSVYKVTKDIIADTAQKKQIEAIKRVITTEYDNDPVLNKQIVGNLEVYPATKGGKVTTLAIKSISTGYSGNVEVMTGLLPDGTLSKLVVVSQTETPGLGTKVTEPAFLSQFEGKNLANFVLKVKKDGGDVDAVTGATISSRAVTSAIAKAHYYFVNGEELQDAKTGATKAAYKDKK